MMIYPKPSSENFSICVLQVITLSSSSMCLCSLCQNLTLAVPKRIFPLSRQWKKCLIKYQEQFKALGIRILHCSSKKINKYQSSWKFVNAWLMTKLKVKFRWFNCPVCRIDLEPLTKMACILLPKLFWPTVRKNCSSDREKLLKFEAEGREFAKFLRSLEQFIQTVNRQKNFW